MKNTRTTRVVVRLHDGRLVDVTGVEPERLVEHLRLQGVKRTDVRDVIHQVAGPWPVQYVN